MEKKPSAYERRLAAKRFKERWAWYNPPRTWRKPNNSTCSSCEENSGEVLQSKNS